MSIFQSIILGLVQGVTEALPISSSGHLILVPHFFGWQDHSLSFDIALHFGTLIAVLIYFWRDWKEIIQSFFASLSRSNSKPGETTPGKNFHYPPNTIWLILLATLPGAIAGLFLNDLAENAFRSPLLISGTLVFFGLLLFLVDKKAPKNLGPGQLKAKSALTVGVAQAIAIIPGTSRSGITITAGRFLGFDRRTAARFSFLLSAPIIFGAAVFKLPSFFQSHFGVVEIAGILSATISGLLSIHFLLKLVQKKSYGVFFWYRLALAILIVAIWFIK